jgi:hypothetical protein
VTYIAAQTWTPADAEEGRPSLRVPDAYRPDDGTLPDLLVPCSRYGCDEWATHRCCADHPRYRCGDHAWTWYVPLTTGGDDA